MQIYTLLALLTYFSIIIAIGIKATHKQRNAEDYLLGGRGLNYWVTAISACASDMSIWLFMGLPAVVYSEGMMQAWLAVGLIIFMFLSWRFLAPKLRTETEKFDTITLSSFFEKRFQDDSGQLRIITAIMLLFYLTVYISAGLIGLGTLFETLFGLDYMLGCLLGLCAIFCYALVGGFAAVAWTDFFQGLFLLAAILLVPSLAFLNSGGFEAMALAAEAKNLSLQLFPDFSTTTIFLILNIGVAWGFGYFGQPHILNKFMAISNPKDLQKSKWISFVWQTLALSASVFMGLVALSFLKTQPENLESIFMVITKSLFHPYFAGLILCAILAATISTIDSQIIVLASVLAEDIYKKIFNTDASDKAVLFASRFFVIIIALFALLMAAARPASIFKIVEYAWFGLGSAFGPALLYSLYSKNITKQAALWGILTGGIVSALWLTLNTNISAMFPGAGLSFLVMFILSRQNRTTVI